MRNKTAYILLALLAILCGIIWRVELEYHGWGGLTWLYYFHYALPIIFLSLLAWANFHLPEIGWLKRIGFNMSSVVLATAFYFLMVQSVFYILARGPASMYFYVIVPAWIRISYILFILFILLFVPVWISSLLRWLHLNIKGRHLLISMLLYWLAVPVSIILLYILDHRGQSDFIHAIKSGFVFPFITFAIGILFIGIRKDDEL